MALNVDNLTFEQAHDYYVAYQNGDDKTGIGAQVAQSPKWKDHLKDWETDATTYDIDKKNLHTDAATTSLAFGGASALTAGANQLMSGGSSNSLLGKLFGKGKGGEKAAEETTEESSKESKTGPGTLVHCILTTASATLGLISTSVATALQKKSIEDQNKVINATKKEFLYDFEGKIQEADEQKEYAMMQYENALAVIEENEGEAALSDAVSGALSESNQGLSEVAANQSTEIRDKTGKELTELSDSIYENGATIPNNIEEFNQKKAISDQMIPYAQQAVSTNKQNKIGMLLAGAGAAMSTMQAVSGIAAAAAQSPVKTWMVALYAVALGMSIATAVMAVIEAKKATDAQTKSEGFAADSEILGANADMAVAEANAKQSEYDDAAEMTAELSQAYGGTGGKVTSGNNLA